MKKSDQFGKFIIGTMSSFILCCMIFLFPKIAFSESTVNTEENESTWIIQFVGLEEYAQNGKNIPDSSEILSYSYGIYEYIQEKDKKREIELSDLSIVKKFDALSPYLFLAALEKKNFQKVILNLKKSDILIRYELTNVILTSVRPGGSSYSSEDVPFEEVSLRCEKIKIIYSDKNSKGEVEAKTP